VHEGRSLGVLDSEHHEVDFFRSAHLHALTLIAQAAAPRVAALLA
jgi:hypothetical protein